MKAGQEAGVFAAFDPQHLILSSLGIHFLPFAMTGLTERMMSKLAARPGVRRRASRRRARAYPRHSDGEGPAGTA